MLAGSSAYRLRAVRRWKDLVALSDEGGAGAESELLNRPLGHLDSKAVARLVTGSSALPLHDHLSRLTAASKDVYLTVATQV